MSIATLRSWRPARPRAAALGVTAFLIVTGAWWPPAPQSWASPAAAGVASPPAGGPDAAVPVGPGARFRVPVDPVQLLRPFAAPAHRYAPGHRGVDLAAPVGAAVYSPADGTVVFAGAVAGRPVLAIDHGDGWRTAMEPVMAAAGLSVGKAVSRGENIGTVAGGAHCPSSCVHWGVRLAGDYVDPMSLVALRVVLLPLRPMHGPPPAARSPAGHSPP